MTNSHSPSSAGSAEANHVKDVCKQLRSPIYVNQLYDAGKEHFDPLRTEAANLIEALYLAALPSLTGDVAQGCVESRENIAKAIAYDLENGSAHGAKVATTPHLDNYHINGHVNLLALADAVIASHTPAALVETDDVTAALNARQAAINEMMAAPVETKSAIDMIAACYEGLCPDGSSALDFEWARQRGYILPNNGSGKLSPAQCSAGNEPRAWEAIDPDLNHNATLTRDPGVAEIWRKAGLTVRQLYSDPPQALNELGELSPDEIAVVKDFRVSYERMRAYTLTRPHRGGAA
jgi:hypothetical protein